MRFTVEASADIVLATGPNQWEVKYKTHEESFLFVFRGNGTGICRDIDYGTEISFSWNANQAPQEGDHELTAFFRELADELFWADINDQLGEDAVISDSEWAEDFGGREVEFACGSQQELENLTRLVLYSFPSMWSDGSEQRSISFSAEGENSGENAG
ncbi:MAG: hypothetical protein ACREQ5_10840, partial [Candidatus Dormibacteria bacterium]